MILFWCALVQGALAGGSIDWGEVKSRVAKTDPKLVEIIERSFTVRPGGTGVRLGPRFGERQGERIAPYRFYAEIKKTRKEIVLVIEESDDFEYTGRFKFTWEWPEKEDQTRQPATRLAAEPEGGDQSQPEAERRSR